LTETICYAHVIKMPSKNSL